MLAKFLRNSDDGEQITVVGLTHEEAWKLIDDKEAVLEFKATIGPQKVKLVIFSEDTDDEVDSTFIGMFGEHIPEVSEN